MPPGSSEPQDAPALGTTYFDVLLDSQPELQPQLEVLKGVDKYDDELVDRYIDLAQQRSSTLNFFALIATLVAGAGSAQLSTYDGKAWASSRPGLIRSYVYLLLMAFSVSVSVYCSVVVVMTLAAASRLVVLDNRLKKRSLEDIYQEYQRPGSVLNHLMETQGWTAIVEKHGRRRINYPVSFRYISEKYEEIGPFMRLFPVSTAAFIFALFLRITEKVESATVKGMLATVVLPILGMTWAHARAANSITFYQLTMQDERTHLLKEQTLRAGTV
jgi:hypothetical protein